MTGTDDLLVEQLRGQEIRFRTRPGVFSKKGLDPGTRLLIERLEPVDGSTIADLGCGTGVIGMVCAKLAPRARVHLLDDHLRAVELAKQNIALNGLQNAAVYLSDLFSAVEDERYDSLFANLPAQLGNAFLEEAVVESFGHLAPGGELSVVVVQNLKPVLERYLRRIFGDCSLRARGAQYVVLTARRGQ